MLKARSAVSLNPVEKLGSTCVAHWISLFYALTIQFALTIILPSMIISHY
jgi:hypothetical protein